MAYDPSASQEGQRSKELVHTQSHSYALFAFLHFIRRCQFLSTDGRRRENHILFRPRDKTHGSQAMRKVNHSCLYPANKNNHTKVSRYAAAKS